MSEMTDKELIELAAKAAGISKQWDGSLVDRNHPNRVWNPLTDDGDALRLAVALGFVIDRNPSGTIIYAGLWDSPKWDGVDVDNGDAMTATRRAITSAAAQIGKGME